MLRCLLGVGVAVLGITMAGWGAAGPARAVVDRSVLARAVRVSASSPTDHLAARPAGRPRGEDVGIPSSQAPEAARSVPVTLVVSYANGVRPRFLLLARVKGRGWAGRNDDRSGVFRFDLPPGVHDVKMMFDALAAHRGDPLPLGPIRWTIDTGDPRTWECVIPVAARIIVHEPKRGLPELWRDGRRVAIDWQEWGTTHGGPAYLATANHVRGYRPPQIALVEPGIYTLYRGTGGERWSVTAVLTACRPHELDRPPSYGAR